MLFDDSKKGIEERLIDDMLEDIKYFNQSTKSKKTLLILVESLAVYIRNRFPEKTQ